MSVVGFWINNNNKNIINNGNTQQQQQTTFMSFDTIMINIVLSNLIYIDS